MCGCMCACMVISGFMAATSLFTLVVLCVTVFICVSYTCFGHFKYLSPHNYMVSACMCVVWCVYVCTFRPYSICVPLQVKQEDEDAKDGLAENVMASVHIAYHVLHLNIFDPPPHLVTMSPIKIRPIVNFAQHSGMWNSIQVLFGGDSSLS